MRCVDLRQVRDKVYRMCVSQLSKKKKTFRNYKHISLCNEKYPNESEGEWRRISKIKASAPKVVK